MIELRTLGAVDLRRGDGAEVLSVLSQPKRTALLCYLALARPRGFHRRDTLLALFWPERDTEHARSSLRQAVRFLRQSLGDDFVRSRGDEEVGLGDGVLRCDAVCFEEALDGGDAPRALALYTGELLPGFYIEGAPEFERWLEAERARLQQRAVAAAWGLAEASGNAGGAREAADWGRHALELAPTDDGLLCSCMGLLARLGDPGGACAAYDAYARRLRAEFELQPSPRAEELADRLRAEAASRPAPASPEPRSPASEHLSPLPRTRQPLPAAAGLQSHATPASPSAAKAVPEDQAPPADAPAVEASLPQVPAPGAAMESTPRLPSPLPKRRRARRVWAAAVSATVVLAALIYVATRRRPAAGPRLDPNVIVVLPFRVVGADTTLRYLREAMVDLLAMKLSATGEDRRVLDPRALLSAWRRWVAPGSAEVSDLPPDSARELARRLGAGELIMGEVVSAPGRIVLNASVRQVGSGRRSALISVEGSIDSVFPLVDRLAAGILAARAGKGAPEQIPYFRTEPSLALRAYLEGQALYRRGRTAEAEEQFRTALEVDSTFALAALGQYQAAVWAGDQDAMQSALPQAWRWRRRLAPPDSAMLHALLGTRYPAPTPMAERLATWRALVGRQPDRAEAWLEFGDRLFHDGTLVDEPDVLAQADAAFERAIALDSSQLALWHLVEIAALRGDTAAFRRRSALLVAGTAGGSRIALLIWSAYLGDPGARETLLVAADTAPLAEFASGGPWVMLGYLDNLVVQKMERRTRWRMGARSAREGYGRSYVWALNRGRPQEAWRWLDSMGAGPRPYANEIIAINGAVYWDGSPDMGARAARSLEAAGDRLTNAGLLALEQWRLSRGDTRGAREAIRRLAEAGTNAADRQAFALAARLLGVMLAAAEHAPELPVLMERLDSTVREGPVLAETEGPSELLPNINFYVFLAEANLTLARLRMQAGDARGALRAASRHTILYGWLSFSSTFYREQALAALAAGDRATARRAADLYLRVRSDPEPEQRPAIEAFRRQFAELAQPPTVREQSSVAGPIRARAPRGQSSAAPMPRMNRPGVGP